jgi:hypothetical protein
VKIEYRLYLVVVYFRFITIRTGGNSRLKKMVLSENGNARQAHQAS